MALAGALRRRLAGTVAGKRSLHAVWRRAHRHVAGVLLFGARHLAIRTDRPRRVDSLEPGARADPPQIPGGSRSVWTEPDRERNPRLQRETRVVDGSVG